MSLDHLINLAQRTGDRLIVHNPTDNQDVVIMSVDEYENLIDGKRSARSLSSDQLLDQINRDIAVWRSNREQDEEWERTTQIEDELWEEEMKRSSFGEFREDDWCHAGRVLEGLYRKDFDDNDYYFDDEEDEDDSGNDFGPSRFDLEENLIEDNLPEIEDIPFPFDDMPSSRDRDDAEVDDIPFGPPISDTTWEEEPLPSEEPVFYEEPV
ncbi:MAG: hypothetical protein WC862_00765 [Patescibacteria group bacterium]